jgi:hypothetical protein
MDSLGKVYLASIRQHAHGRLTIYAERSRISQSSLGRYARDVLKESSESIIKELISLSLPYLENSRIIISRCFGLAAVPP